MHAQEICVRTHLLTKMVGTLTPSRSNSNAYGDGVHEGQGLAEWVGGGFLPSDSAGGLRDEFKRGSEFQNE